MPESPAQALAPGAWWSRRRRRWRRPPRARRSRPRREGDARRARIRGLHGRGSRGRPQWRCAPAVARVAAPAPGIARAESAPERGRLGEAPPVPRRRRWLRLRLPAERRRHARAKSARRLLPRELEPPRGAPRCRRRPSRRRRLDASPSARGYTAGNCAPTGFTREARRLRPEPRAIRTAARRCRGADGDAGAERKVRAVTPRKRRRWRRRGGAQGSSGHSRKRRRWRRRGGAQGSSGHSEEAAPKRREPRPRARPGLPGRSAVRVSSSPGARRRLAQRGAAGPAGRRPRRRSPAHRRRPP